MDETFTDLPKWISDLPNAEYHAGPGFSSSGIESILISPGHYKARDKPATDALLESSAFHCWLLEPHKFDESYKVEAGTRTKKMKEEYADCGIELITQTQWDKIRYWADAVKTDKTASWLISQESEHEVSGYWRDEKTGVLCKIRPDIKINKHRYVVDLKTMTMAKRPSASLFDKFSEEIVHRRYDWRAAFYLRGASQIDGLDYVTFIWIVICKEPPYEVVCVVATDEMIENGNAAIDKALEIYAEAESTNNWWKRFYDGFQNAQYPMWHVPIIFD